MTTRDQIVTEARKWLGTPWKHQGRTKYGIDCAGLVIRVAKDLGLSDYDTANYGRLAQSKEFMSHFENNMLKKRLIETKPGDVLLFRDNQFPCHSSIVGCIGESLTIIHAYAKRRMVVEDRIDQGDWMDRRVAAFEFKGVEQ